MKNNNYDSLGTRMKSYEKRYAEQNTLPTLPILIRIDGRCFHSFTRGLARPYDERLCQLMIDTTKYLVKETNARCGYTQSDEISLCLLSDQTNSENFFNGKISKLTSITASLTTAFFNKKLVEYIPEKASKLAIFDSRVWEVPLQDEVSNYLIWRQQDCVKNSISMAAQKFFSHSQLHQKDGPEKLKMLYRQGVKWDNYPSFFTRGTYVRKREILRPFTTQELSQLPEKHNFRKDSNLVVKKTRITNEDLLLTNIVNRNEVVLFGVDPVFKEN